MITWQNNLVAYMKCQIAAVRLKKVFVKVIMYQKLHILFTVNAYFWVPVFCYNIVRWERRGKLLRDQALYSRSSPVDSATAAEHLLSESSSVVRIITRILDVISQRRRKTWQDYLALCIFVLPLSLWPLSLYCSTWVHCVCSQDIKGKNGKGTVSC